MKRVIINDGYLDYDDIEDEVIRVKGLLVNSNNEVLLCHNNYTFQFPGGHVEDGELYNKAMLREIKEETGISLDKLDNPFMQIVTFDDNYLNTGRKTCNKIYYYVINTDKYPNFNETWYDELERQTDFNLYYYPVNKLKEFLHKCMDDGTIELDIGREMLLVSYEYNKLYGGV